MNNFLWECNPPVTNIYIYRNKQRRGHIMHACFHCMCNIQILEVVKESLLLQVFYNKKQKPVWNPRCCLLFSSGGWGDPLYVSQNPCVLLWRKCAHPNASALLLWMETVIHLIKKHKQLPTLYYMQLICKYSKLAYMEVATGCINWKGSFTGEVQHDPDQQHCSVSGSLASCCR